MNRIASLILPPYIIKYINDFQKNLYCLCIKLYKIILNLGRQLLSYQSLPIGDPTNLLPQTLPPNNRALFTLAKSYQSNFDRELKASLSGIKSATKLTLFERALQADITTFNKLISAYKDFKPLNNQDIDKIKPLAVSWHLLEAATQSKANVIPFNALAKAAKVEKFQGPDEILQTMREQFRVYICSLFEYIHLEIVKLDRRQPLLQMLEHLYAISSKIDPKLDTQPDNTIITKSVNYIKDGDFKPICNQLLQINHPTAKLHYLLLISRQEHRNIISILKQPYAMSAGK